MRDVGQLLAVLGLLVGTHLADSPLATGMRNSALIYLAADFLLQVRAGYLRRRPHWTRSSWRRYLIACSVPVGALLAMAASLVALNLGVGQARSATRGVLILVLFTSLFVGAGGLAVVLRWLTHGEAGRQFAGPGWFRRRGDEAA